VFSVLAVLYALDPSEQQEAIKKMEQAVARTNIFNLPSFRMKADVQIDSQGKSLDGTYKLSWNGPDEWKEEINFPGYGEVQVGAKGTVWIQRSTDFFPLRIYDLHTALGFGSGSAPVRIYSASFVQLGLTHDDTIKKINSRKQHGDRLTCVEVQNEQKISSEICMNDITGTLVRDSSYEDRDLQPVGEKVFPRFLSFAGSGKTVATINVRELNTPVQFPPDSFAPPPGVSPRAGCMNPVPFRAIKKIAPKYPESARKRPIGGTVSVDVWIGSDGVPRIGPVVGHADPELEKSTMEAITQWRYAPAMCSGNPVEVETVLQVNYTFTVSH
jgi:TonB family protein